MIPVDLLYLSGSDVELCGINDARRWVDVCEEVFRLLQSGDYLMGGLRGNSHGMGLPLPTNPRFSMPTGGGDRRFVTMPAYIGGRFDICGNKWYGSNPDNVSLGLPRSILTLQLNDKTTGQPLSLMSANLISATRTGAVPVVATRALGLTPSSIAVVGCGVVSESVMRAFAAEYPGLRRAVVYDVNAKAAERFSSLLSHELGIEGVIASSAEACVSSSDLVTVAASRTAPLHIASEAFSPSATVILSGPMTSDEAFWAQSTLIFDHVPMHEEYMRESLQSENSEKYLDSVIGGPVYRLIGSGKIPPLEQATDIGTMLKCADYEQTETRAVVIASGMAVFDVAVGSDIYAVAKGAGIGTRLDLW